jgi:hypothetical protein
MRIYRGIKEHETRALMVHFVRTIPVQEAVDLPMGELFAVLLWEEWKTKVRLLHLKFISEIRSRYLDYSSCSYLEEVECEMSSGNWIPTRITYRHRTTADSMPNQHYEFRYEPLGFFVGGLTVSVQTYAPPAEFYVVEIKDNVVRGSRKIKCPSPSVHRMSFNDRRIQASFHKTTYY